MSLVKEKDVELFNIILEDINILTKLTDANRITETVKVREKLIKNIQYVFENLK